MTAKPQPNPARLRVIADMIDREADDQAFRWSVAKEATWRAEADYLRETADAAARNILP